VPISVSLLKGRANYVCHYHLERAQANGRLASKQDAAWLREISRFAKTTTSGDKAELAEVPENAPVWQIVTSTRDNCLGSECPNYKECFVMRARKEAQQADLVVVNHHLFFADVVLRDTGMAELLPAANTVIFDEAHQLPETATLFFGETLSTSQLLELARDTVAEGLSHARDAVDWVALGAPLERAARDLRLAFGRRTPALRWGRSTPTRAFASRFTKRSTRSTRRCPTLSRHWNRRPSVPRSLNSAIAARSNSPSGWRHGATTGLPHPPCGRAGRRCGRRPESPSDFPACPTCPAWPRNRTLGGSVLAHGAVASDAVVDRADLQPATRRPTTRVGLHLCHAVREGQLHPLRRAAWAGSRPIVDTA
jgi:hypothetical protein